MYVGLKHYLVKCVLGINLLRSLSVQTLTQSNVVVLGINSYCHTKSTYTRPSHYNCYLLEYKHKSQLVI